MHTRTAAAYARLRAVAWPRVALTLLAAVPFVLGWLIGAVIALVLWVVAAVVAGYQAGRG